MLNLNRSNFQAHPFHLVSPSPWPLYTSICLLSLTTSAVLSFHGFANAEYNIMFSLTALILSMSFWWRDVIAEGTYIGHHTLAVQRGLNLGVGLFIVSEALFFLAIFWTFFHSALSPAVELGAMWPPLGIEAIDPFELPLINTVILLASGFTVTYGHHYLINGDRSKTLYGLLYTIILAAIFTGLQGVEYSVSSFTISDGAFGSCFYFGTGLTPAPFKAINPNWITGFADAESSFIVRVGTDTSRKIPTRILPVFTIELHKKDLQLIKDIQSFFGVGTVKLRQRDGKPSVIYSVQSIKDLTETIIPHFKEYPLLTQKRADFILFSRVISLMNQKKHLELNGIVEIISIRASMNKGLTSTLKTVFPNIIPVERPIIELQVIKDPWWLVGFIDGEGCFYVKVRKSAKYTTGFQVGLAFSISQHSRDSSLLKIIKDYLGCGVIENISTRQDSSTFVVYNINDLLNKIIPFFNKNPLLGNKLLDYHYFYHIAYLMKYKAHLTEKGVNKILKIKIKMNTGRIS